MGVKTFGQDWLGRWEDERDERASELVPPPKAPISSVDIARRIVMDELTGILSSAYARQVTEKIVDRLAIICRQTPPPKI